MHTPVRLLYQGSPDLRRVGWRLRSANSRPTKDARSGEIGHRARVPHPAEIWRRSAVCRPASPQRAPHGRRRAQRPMPGDPEHSQRARCSRRPALLPVPVGSRDQSQYLVWHQRSIGTPAAVALCDPAAAGAAYKPVGNQRIVDDKDDERAERSLRGQRNHRDLAFGRQCGAHTAAAQREAKRAFPGQRVSQQREPGGCGSCARRPGGLQARHSFTAAATSTTCCSVRVRLDGK